MICTIEDDYVAEKPRWVAVLDDGQTVYQDDDRPGADPPSAWKRLGAHCRENRRRIAEFWLQFRSHRILIEPKNADGYYFVKGAYRLLDAPTTHHTYVVGALIGDVVKTSTWQIPELILIGREDRHPDFDSPTLIS